MRKISVRKSVAAATAVLLLLAFPVSSLSAVVTGNPDTAERPVLTGVSNVSGNEAFGTTQVITPTGITAGELESSVDAAVKPYIGDACPGAAIVIVKDGTTVLSKGYGNANLVTGVDVDPEATTFEWGSVSKTFIWTLVMHLKEEGLIDLDAPISRYLPADFVANLHLRYEITMKDLMNHRAGFEEVFYDVISTEKRAACTLRDALLNYVPTQCYQPNTVSAYSNYSAALAAYIVECITKVPYADYLRAEILTPLGMQMTAVEQDRSDAPEVLATQATGYQKSEDGTTKEGFNSYVNLYPAGAMAGTATDLAKFASALCAEDCPLFDDAATRDEMFTSTYSPCDAIPGCAHGFWPYFGDVTAYGHGGNTLYFSSYFLVVPEEHLAVVILTNMQYEERMINEVGRLIFGAPATGVPAAPGTAMPDPAEVSGGTYVVSRSNFTAPLFGLMNALSLYTVEKNGENGIAIASAVVPSERFTFTQTAPYIYTADSEDSIAPTIAFLRDAEGVAAIHISGDEDLVPVNRVIGPDYRSALPSFVLLAAIVIFCLLSLPVYLGIAIAGQIRKPDPERTLTRESRRVRRNARLSVATGLISFGILFSFFWRTINSGDLSKITANLHTGGLLLTAILFAALAIRLAVLLIREKRQVRRTVAVKAVLTTLFVGAMYIVLALWNFFAII